MPFNVGENVGPYRVLEKLGQGGMATVYKAYHASLDRYVALKVLHPAFLEDTNFLARFQREARLVAKLEHPNIVPVYDFAEHDEQPYLVMKYIEGETLKAYLGRGRLNVEQIWDVVDAVGAGLAYAHKQGILHRDIKPSNVIVAKDGQMYLADFGLARIAQSGESTLSSDMIMGTPQYISPEQAMGAKDLDAGTDIYSFAVMLYEMVVGQVPFSSDTPFSIIHDHIYSPLPLPRTVNPNVPDEVERVLLKALAKERTDRFISVPDLIKAFKQAWSDSDVDMAEVTMTAPIRKPKPMAEKVIPAPPAEEPAQASTVAQVESEPAEEPPPVQLVEEPIEKAKTEKVAPVKTKKKRSPWPFIAGGVLLVLACIFVLVSLNRDGLEPLPMESDSEISEPVSQPTKRINAPSDERPANPPVSPEVEAARINMEENPEDPYAHLELSLALLDANPGQNPFAYEELNAAADLAGDNIDFFFDAGITLMEREAWTGASAMFLRASKHLQARGEENKELTYFFHESVYKAASQPELPNYLPFEAIGSVDEPMMLVVQARHTFYHGNPNEALGLLNDVKRMKPGFPEALLLDGEINARGRKFDEARVIFETLLADLNTPEWVRVEAEEALRKFP